MYTDFLSVGMVTVIGLIAGPAIGLFIGYLSDSSGHAGRI